MEIDVFDTNERKFIVIDNDNWLQFGNESKICRDIFYYSRYMIKNDMVSYIDLDIKDFSDKMGWSLDDLNSIVDIPYQHELLYQYKKAAEKKILDLRIKQESFETVFENAIFLLFNQSMLFQSRVKTKKDDILLSKRLMLFSSILISIDEKGVKEIKLKPNENYSQQEYYNIL